MSGKDCYAFTLRICTFEPGIHVTKYCDGRREIQVGDLFPNCRSALLEPGQFSDEEFGPHSTLLTGRFVRDEDSLISPHRVRLREDDSGILLRIMAANLRFGLPAFAEGLTFNQGAEGIEPFLQYGRPKNGARDQLFQLKNDDFIYVGDHRGAIVEVYCKDDAPHFRPAKRDGLVKLIYDYGMREGQMVNAMVWSHRSLIALDADRNMLDRLARRIPPRPK